MQAPTPAPAPIEPAEDDDDDEPLNEDDDDELDDLEQGEDLNTTHLVLAQFDKVTELQLAKLRFFIMKLHLILSAITCLDIPNAYTGDKNQEQVEVHTEGRHYARK